MTIPKYDEMYKEILISISDGSSHSINSIRNSVAQQKNVSDEERTLLLNSGTRPVFDDRVGWARTYLKEAGLLEYPKRGYTRITTAGNDVLVSNPTEIDNNFLSRYDSFLAFRSRSKPDQILNTGSVSENYQEKSTPAEQMENAFAEINLSLSDEILSEIMNHSPAFFERLVIRLLAKMGYGVSLGDNAGFITPFSRDAGIDGVVSEDKLGFSNIFFQAKRWNTDITVNRPEIQKFIGAIANKAGKGLFITTSSFSEGAKQCAQESHIILIDGKHLTSLMIEYGVGVSASQIYEIKKIDSDFFQD
jgi:restriction system protein